MIVEEKRKPVPAIPEASVTKSIRSLVRKAAEKNHQPDTLGADGITDPSGRYAEHRKVEALNNAETYYYQGTGFIAGMELELMERLKGFLGGKEVETRVISFRGRFTKMG